ncbi:MAG TPA: GGDEF domain-containing protein [Thermoclostridium sp.]|nr:GGDEF domain-containing protein [Clostridiaceae bacterium]HOQ76328.1 GGDEF domain-containing protein [Thermoclostridium sp.]HPU45165.1 GGDEF domain-containing protein [Thermoclostridium sp.]
MFYLNFENQLQLLLLLAFSSYIFVSALAIRLEDPRLKATGLSFAIPLILGIYSFIIGPYNINGASLYLELAWFLLILVLALVSLLQRPSESLKFLYAVIFLLPAAALFIQSILLMLDYRFYVLIITLAIAAIELSMTVICLVSRSRERVLLYSGIFLMASGSILVRSSILNPLLAIIPAAAGLYLCAHYFYSNSYGVLKAEHSRFSHELERINRSIHAEIMRRVQEIEKSNRQLVEKSKTDNMTGLYLKSTIMSVLANMIERTPTSRFSLLMLDIDNFKEINDSLGHQTGDKCIKTVSKLIQTSFRKDDIPGRYGGDEFLIILPGASAVRAYVTADRFRQTVQEKSNPNVTISAGVATYPDDGKSVADIIAAADKALYASKQAGRNRVTCYNMVKDES